VAILSYRKHGEPGRRFPDLNPSNEDEKPHPGTTLTVSTGFIELKE
jgi:hypothetical protein